MRADILSVGPGSPKPNRDPAYDSAINKSALPSKIRTSPTSGRMNDRTDTNEYVRLVYLYLRAFRAERGFAG